MIPLDGEFMPQTSYVDVAVYCDTQTDLQKDPVLRRVHDDLSHTHTAVHVIRRAGLPCTLVTTTWVEGTIDA